MMIQVIRCHDRYTNCASCKARAAWFVVRGEWRASACDRHLSTWRRRAVAAAV